ncbi:MAG: tRNA (adenosine(37)-N6)-dimethylallyltransferase MiaA [Fidelibacterota bacterium]
MSNRSVLTIVGPTASGKTSLAVALARRISGEVISLDSRQVFRGMAIGTAQPTPEEQGGVRHHLIGFRDPREAISAGEYAHLVRHHVKDIMDRGFQPIICGGAGLYYRAVTRGIFPDSVTDLEARDRLNRDYDELGGEVLLRRLEEIDPDYAAITHPNNRKRLVRALEIFAATGKPPSEHFRGQDIKGKPGVKCFTVYLDWEPGVLETRIRERTLNMLENGWIDEVRRLRERYGRGELHPLDSIGYRQIGEYLDGVLPYDELVDVIVLRTRQYAKRQRQWFRHEPVDLTLTLTPETTVGLMVQDVLAAYHG